MVQPLELLSRSRVSYAHTLQTASTPRVVTALVIPANSQTVGSYPALLRASPPLRSLNLDNPGCRYGKGVLCLR